MTEPSPPTPTELRTSLSVKAQAPSSGAAAAAGEDALVPKVEPIDFSNNRGCAFVTVSATAAAGVAAVPMWYTIAASTAGVIVAALIAAFLVLGTATFAYVRRREILAWIGQEAIKQVAVVMLQLCLPPAIVGSAVVGATGIAATIQDQGAFGLAPADPAANAAAADAGTPPITTPPVDQAPRAAGSGSRVEYTTVVSPAEPGRLSELDARVACLEEHERQMMLALRSIDARTRPVNPLRPPSQAPRTSLNQVVRSLRTIIATPCGDTRHE